MHGPDGHGDLPHDGIPPSDLDSSRSDTDNQGSGNWETTSSNENTTVSGHATNEPASSSRARMPALTAIALLAWTALADWLIYRTYGYAGPALFVAASPLFFVLLARRPSQPGEPSGSYWVTRAVLIVLVECAALRLVFQATPLALISASLLVTALALVTSGVYPWALETLAAPFRSFVDGLMWLAQNRLPRVGGSKSPEPPRTAMLSWFLPLVATIVFGGIFVLANPDLFQFVSGHWTWMSSWAWNWISRLDALEAPFCAAALVLGAGLIHPFFARKRIGGVDAPQSSGVNVESPLYAAFRNTLICVILLFSVYLVFEFKTLFKREFPDGFYYAGYAHEGAAWLTAALALATSVLSLIFRRATLADNRVGQLKFLAWIWSATNFLLAVAVYNRLAIYVGYNGLTPMRIVGFFGISAVVIGFCLVLAKIALDKGFWWLLRTQLTALMVAIIGLTLFPVDYTSHRYNQRKIDADYLPPSVMIAVKSKDDSGYLPMLDLVDCPDEVIRNGVLAMLADRQQTIEDRTAQSPWHWTRYQGATARLYRGMAEREHLWQQYRQDSNLRLEAINRFEDYAMKWY